MHGVHNLWILNGVLDIIVWFGQVPQSQHCLVSTMTGLLQKTHYLFSHLITFTPFTVNGSVDLLVMLRKPFYNLSYLPIILHPLGISRRGPIYLVVLKDRVSMG